MEDSRPEFLRMSPAERLMPQEEMLEVPRQSSKLIIGVPKEISPQENRVGIVPDGIALLCRNGHQVIIETGAGNTAHFSDHEYSEAGAQIVFSPEEVYKSDIVLKVAPVTLTEIEWLHPKQTIFSAIQMAMQGEDYFRGLLSKRVTALAFETLRDKTNRLAVIRAMSEIAGSTVIFIAAEYLASLEYGRGKMFGGVTGITPSEVMIIGAGTVGEFAARSALGLGALVKIFDNSVYRLRRIQNNLGQRVYTSILHPNVLLESLKTADVLLGAVHSLEGRTPCLISEEMIKQMKEGAVAIDVSIDQGGCFETSHPTTHQSPVFKMHGVTHYAVPNIPSKVPHTASQALNNILVPIILEIGSVGGIENLLKRDFGVQQGVYVYNGTLTNQFISKRYNLPFQDIGLLMAAFH
ncbi:MAG: alanine dehydrogenase [Bacteroidales bacterium]|nr:alanine dehydrogenase [Bacteroidales bacterium]MDD4604232.1 alanine dehydrogenase [Bacteroidales bacterium]